MQSAHFPAHEGILGGSMVCPRGPWEFSWSSGGHLGLAGSMEIPDGSCEGLGGAGVVRVNTCRGKLKSKAPQCVHLFDARESKVFFVTSHSHTHTRCGNRKNGLTLLSPPLLFVR